MQNDAGCPGLQDQGCHGATGGERGRGLGAEVVREHRDARETRCSLPPSRQVWPGHQWPMSSLSSGPFAAVKQELITRLAVTLPPVYAETAV